MLQLMILYLFVISHVFLDVYILSILENIFFLSFPDIPSQENFLSSGFAALQPSIRSKDIFSLDISLATPLSLLCWGLLSILSSTKFQSPTIRSSESAIPWWFLRSLRRFWRVSFCCGLLFGMYTFTMFSVWPSYSRHSTPDLPCSRVL